jgi:type I restriction enzyme R subunit
MRFNELNSVEHYIIHQLSGVNLINGTVSGPNRSYGPSCVCKSIQELNRVTEGICTYIKVNN